MNTNDRRVALWDDPGFVGFTNRLINSEGWRVQYCMDEDDVRQELFLVFMRVLEGYPTVTIPKHLMSLYQTSVRRQFYDWDRAYFKTARMVDVDTTQLRETVSGDGLRELELRTILAKLPRELVELLKTLYKDPAEFFGGSKSFKGVRAKRGISKLPTRETTNEAFCRLMGVPPSRDLASRLRGFIENV